MLAASWVASAGFAPSAAPTLWTTGTHRPAAASVRLQHLDVERVESVKAGAIAAAAGTLVDLPIKASTLLSTSDFWSKI